MTTHEYRDLPTWKGPRNGNGCDNPRCELTTGYLRVLSTNEVEHVYPKKEGLSWWPLPPQATHVCTSCGFCYGGIAEELTARHEHTSSEDITEIPIDDWEWSHQAQFDMTVKEAVEAFIDGAPADATADDVIIGVNRYVTGADAEFARDRLAARDEEFDGVVIDTADFM